MTLPDCYRLPLPEGYEWGEMVGPDKRAVMRDGVIVTVFGRGCETAVTPESGWPKVLAHAIIKGEYEDYGNRIRAVKEFYE